jgi:hypothetical protein
MRADVPKYWLKFCSPCSVVPHGVDPPAQLFSVPSTVVPVGSAKVRTYSEPAAGPESRMGVVAVIRRFRLRRSAWRHRPERPTRCSSSTEMPRAAMAICFCASVVGAASDATPGNISCSSVYSWLTTSSARRSPFRPVSSGRKPM